MLSLGENTPFSGRRTRPKSTTVIHLLERRLDLASNVFRSADNDSELLELGDKGCGPLILSLVFLRGSTLVLKAIFTA